MHSNSCVLSFLVVASNSYPEDPLFEKTFSPEVMFTSLFSGDWKSFTFLVKRENSSSLLVVSCRNIFHFDERLVSLVTFLLWPAPLVSLYGIQNKQFSISKIAWWVIKVLGRSFFFHFLFSIAKQSTKSFAWLSASLACWCMIVVSHFFLAPKRTFLSNLALFSTP